MLLAVGSVAIPPASVMPVQVARYLKLAVGITPIWHSYNVLNRLIHKRIHFHAHLHAGKGAHRRSPHDHSHGGMRSRAFAVGMMLGMVLLSVAISLPLQKLTRSLSWAHNTLNTVTGTATVSFGIWQMYDIGFANGLITC